MLPKITVLIRVGEELILEQGLIVVDDPHGLLWRSTTGVGVTHASRDSEGTWWIRGPHYNGSPEVNAMLTAHALMRA